MVIRNSIIGLLASVIFGFGILILAFILGIDVTWRVPILSIGVMYLNDIATFVYKLLAKKYLGDQAWLFNKGEKK